MAIFKRGRVYWYNFVFSGEKIQASTRQSNQHVARTMEAAHRSRLAKGEVGIVERKPSPTFREFADRFIKSVETQNGDRPQTVSFYKAKLKNLLAFTPLADAPLDKIDEGMIDSFIQHRRAAVSIASTNRALATLRKALRKAGEWRLIDRVPRVHLLPGEKSKGYVLTDAQETAYLNAAPQPLKDAAMLMLDAGLRVGEVLQLAWDDIHFEPVGDTQLGFVTVVRGKSKTPRAIPLLPRSADMLLGRRSVAKNNRVFTSEDGMDPLSVFTLEDQHRRTRQVVGLGGFRIHDCRHTSATRLGEHGADTTELTRVMGWSSEKMAMRYVHPTGRRLEAAFLRLQDANAKKLPEGGRRELPTTVFTTPSESEPELLEQVL